jgi:hypothetical protein
VDIVVVVVEDSCYEATWGVVVPFVVMNVVVDA